MQLESLLRGGLGFLELYLLYAWPLHFHFGSSHGFCYVLEAVFLVLNFLPKRINWCNSVALNLIFELLTLFGDMPLLNYLSLMNYLSLFECF